jgi:transcriptional regulator with XRE-family HTH domain
MIEFGEQLRRVRESKGMTQQTVAEHLYVSRQTVSRWECGERYPDLIMAKKLASFLEVSLDALLSEDEMRKAVQKSAVIEKPIVKKVLEILYACIFFSYALQCADAILRASSIAWPASFQDAALLGLNVLILLIQLALFGYGFVQAIKDILTPKKTGLIAAGYFLSAYVLNVYFILSGRMTFRAFLLTLPYLIGAVAAWLYFCKPTSKKIWLYVVYFASCWGIAFSFYSVYEMVRFATENMTMQTTLNLFLKICIYASIVYQAYILNQKRLRALEAEKSDL